MKLLSRYAMKLMGDSVHDFCGWKLLLSLGLSIPNPWDTTRLLSFSVAGPWYRIPEGNRECSDVMHKVTAIESLLGGFIVSMVPPLI